MPCKGTARSEKHYQRKQLLGNDLQRGQNRDKSGTRVEHSRLKVKSVGNHTRHGDAKAMFTLFQKLGFTAANETETVKPEVSLPVVRVPQSYVEPVKAPAEAQSYNCLNDVFSELLDDQVSYALSKW